MHSTKPTRHLPTYVSLIQVLLQTTAEMDGKTLVTSMDTKFGHCRLRRCITVRTGRCAWKPCCPKPPLPRYGY